MPGHSTDDDAALTAPKRVRREYPWRPEFARDFGVRPIQVNAVSGEALLVECRFCVSFGREPPAQPTAPPLNKDGQPVKTRARTRNVAHWKYPFRTDNMRSHHLQQHSRKWAEYSALLELSKQEDAVGVRAADEGTSALQRLDAFFGEPQEPDAVVAMTTSRPNGSLKTAMSVSMESPRYLESKREDQALLLSTAINAAIGDFVLSTLVDIPTRDAILGDSGRGAEPWLVQVEGSGRDSNGTAADDYAIEKSRGNPDYEQVVELFEAGLSFDEVRAVINIKRPVESRLDRADFVGYAQAFVASSLQRIARLMEKSWTYSLRLAVGVPSGDQVPASLRVSVRVPVDGYRDEEEFHVVTIALHQSPSASEDVENLVRSVLLALDGSFDRKILTVSVVGAVQYLGIHAGLLEGLQKELASPVLHVSDSRQAVVNAVHSAWCLYLNDPSSDPDKCFIGVLFRQVERVRGDNGVVGSLGHCPIMTRNDINSIYRALKWFLVRRDMLAKSGIQLSDWWWIVAHFVADIWTDCLGTTANSGVSEGYGLQAEEKGLAIHQLSRSLKTKCSVSTESGADDGVEMGFLYDENTRVASSVVRHESTLVQMTWTSKNIATCLRSLNVSTRRLFGELTKDSDAILAIEREVSCILLNVVRCLDSSCTKEAELPPPTLPLDFARYDASEIVDFVESYSRRLELVFPTAFLDLVSREIRDLQTLLSSTEDLRRDIEQAASQSLGRKDSFTASWSLVPQFPAVRTLAAGLATSLPRQPTEGDVVRFGRVEEDRMPSYTWADLAVEARAHACQIGRLQKAFEPAHDESSLVV